MVDTRSDGGVRVALSFDVVAGQGCSAAVVSRDVDARRRNPGHLRIRVLASLQSPIPTSTEAGSGQSVDMAELAESESASRSSLVVGRGSYRLLGGGGGGFGVPVVS